MCVFFLSWIEFRCNRISKYTPYGMLNELGFIRYAFSCKRWRRSEEEKKAMEDVIYDKKVGEQIRN